MFSVMDKDAAGLMAVIEYAVNKQGLDCIPWRKVVEANHYSVDLAFVDSPERLRVSRNGVTGQITISVVNEVKETIVSEAKFSPIAIDLQSWIADKAIAIAIAHKESGGMEFYKRGNKNDEV